MYLQRHTQNPVKQLSLRLITVNDLICSIENNNEYRKNVTAVFSSS